MKKILLALLIAEVALMTACGSVLGGSSSGGSSSNPGDMKKVKHIIYFMQENRSFDSYFGRMNAYRESKGLPADVDVTPTDASQVGFDKTTVTPFHMNSMCTEDLSAYWNESHRAFNRQDPTSLTAAMDGFAWAAGNGSTNSSGVDTNGSRVMGYYDSGDLPYYYFMATQFAMSDRWFSPVMSNTPPNRLYAIAGTSHGVVGNLTSNLDIPTIFDRLEAAGVSWKVYVPRYPNGTSLKGLPVYQKFIGDKIVPIDQYFTDLKNGNLPQVALIERDTTKDEHPGTGGSIQEGASFTKSLIDALMNSTAWKDSVFFFTYDEAGGLYDHVPPMQTVSPDGIKPVLGDGDVCTVTTGPSCDFTMTGFRLPNFVVSPFARPHFVDHQDVDTTVILKFIETRFGLDSLTKRDAAQPDISTMFDFTNAPNMNPPKPPAQPTNGPCYITSLP